MIVIAWNARGLRDHGRSGDAASLVMKATPDLLFVSEFGLVQSNVSHFKDA